jgi:hypothetical protein
MLISDLACRQRPQRFRRKPGGLSILSSIIDVQPRLVHRICPAREQTARPPALQGIFRIVNFFYDDIPPDREGLTTAVKRPTKIET